MIPGLMALGSHVRARPPLSGCELGGSPAAGPPPRAGAAGIAAERCRCGIDNNLIAIGVPRLVPRPFAVVTASRRGDGKGRVPVIGSERD
jgi:hypothetical protein